MYHAFTAVPPSADPHYLFVTRDALRVQLSELQRSGWRPLHLDSFVASFGALPTDRNRFLVTIDDGYESVLTIGAPEFAAVGVHPVLFVPPALIGGVQVPRPDNLGAEALLSVDGLKEWLRFGFDVGVHGLDHSIMVGMSDGDLFRHTVSARENLADLTGKLARSFAYPLGALDARAAQAVRHAGYEVGFSVTKDYGRWGVPRTGIAANDSVAAFRIKMQPWFDTVWRATSPIAGYRRHLRPRLDRLDDRRCSGG